RCPSRAGRAAQPAPEAARATPIENQRRHKGGAEVTSLAANLTEAARRHPERVALRLDELEVPYAALDAASARLAGLLAARGLEPGDRVGIMLPNVPYFAIAVYPREIEEVLYEHPAVREAAVVGIPDEML